MFTDDDRAWLRRKIRHLERALHAIEHRDNKLMADFTQLSADVADLKTVKDSVLALIQGFLDKLAALQPNQTAIDALATDLEATKAALAAAVTANTPVPPTA